MRKLLASAFMGPVMAVPTGADAKHLGCVVRPRRRGRPCFERAAGKAHGEG